jgi:hypothetical protein
MVDMQENFREALDSNKVRFYRKKPNTIVGIRPAVPGEVIETWIDGERETVNTAKAGDHVRGLKGEQHVITGQSLASLDGPPLSDPDAQGFRQHAGKGALYAFVYDGEPATFMAPWGEAMLVKRGDYVGTAAVGSNRFWRIEREIFLASYAEERP